MLPLGVNSSELCFHSPSVVVVNCGSIRIELCVFHIIELCFHWHWISSAMKMDCSSIGNENSIKSSWILLQLEGNHKSVEEISASVGSKLLPSWWKWTQYGSEWRSEVYFNWKWTNPTSLGNELTLVEVKSTSIGNDFYFSGSETRLHRRWIVANYKVRCASIGNELYLVFPSVQWVILRWEVEHFLQGSELFSRGR